MATLECTFQINFDSNSANSPKFVTAIKLKGGFSPRYEFDIQDQRLEHHREFMDIINNKRSLKPGEWIGVVLSGLALDKYFDKKKEMFWFNGNYLRTSDKEIAHGLYDPGK